MEQWGDVTFQDSTIFDDIRSSPVLFQTWHSQKYPPTIGKVGE